MRPLLLLVLLVLLAPAPIISAQPTPRCFSGVPGITACIDGRIRQFWEGQGGLPVFGYPISTQHEEGGRQVQLFERARLELHPENAPPYDVLLGRLGADLLARSGQPPAPPSQPQQGCLFVAQTAQNICPPFLTTWRRYGLELGDRGISERESLALWGLPLGPPQRASLPGGESYSVQWFERARFEDHGPLGVMLGLLGRELVEGTTEPAPVPTPGTPQLPPPDEVSARLRVPDGFAVRGFASGLAGPRLLAAGPDGALYVAERQAGRILRLPDADGDGLADEKQTVLSGLLAPHSMDWASGCMYVAENDKVSRHCDGDGDGSLEQHALVVRLPTGGNHTSRTLHIGPDGKLYVAAGSTCNVCVEPNPQRAAIMRFNLDGSIPADNPFANDPDMRRRAVWAEGLRNSIDFLFMPDGQLWANHNGRDNMISAQAKDDRPLEELVIPVQRGRHHGWPYCTSERSDGNTAPGPGPYREAPDPSGDVPRAPAGFNCADAVPALFTATAHAAPIGMARYEGANFPQAYRGDLFVALHGSWNRTPPAACVVVRVRVDEGLPIASEEFLIGFQNGPNQACASAWGRPAGIAAGPDGALYVSDDKNGRVYRIVWTT
jgi:glucose/arabinose dehydrogenase